MLRLNLYCCIVPCSRQVKYGTSFNTIIPQRRNEVSQGRIKFRVRALKDEKNGGKGGGAPGQSWDPGLEIEVPFEQRPVCPPPALCFDFLTSVITRTSQKSISITFNSILISKMRCL